MLFKKLSFDAKWFSNCIITVSGVLNESSTLLSGDQLQNMYSFCSINFLSYLRGKNVENL